MAVQFVVIVSFIGFFIGVFAFFSLGLGLLSAIAIWALSGPAGVLVLLAIRTIIAPVSRREQVRAV